MNTSFIAIRENGSRFLFEAKNFEDARKFCIECKEFDVFGIESFDRFELLDNQMNFVTMYN